MASRDPGWLQSCPKRAQGTASKGLPSVTLGFPPRGPHGPRGSSGRHDHTQAREVDFLLGGEIVSSILLAQGHPCR